MRVTSSVSLAWLGAGTPISAPLRAINPFMASISVRRPLRMSCAIDGRWMSLRGFELAFGISAASTSAVALASPSAARARRSGSTPRICSSWYPSAWPTRTPSPASRIWKRRMAALRRQPPEVSPVAAVTPLPMPFCTSFDQRSPHRLVVALELSMPRNHSTSSSTRGVTRPCGSPTRNTVCLSPPLATVLRMRPGGVVGLDRDHRDIDSPPGERLHLRQMKSWDASNHKSFFGRDAVQFEAACADRLDVLGPGIDHRNVVPEVCEGTADVAAERTGADDGNAFCHKLV